MTPDEDMLMELDAALRQAGAPTDAEVARLDLQQGFAQLQAEVQASAGVSARPRKRRVRRTIVALAGAGALVGGAGVAAAAVYHAHTGQYGSPGKTENDTSEYLDVGAPDFPATVRSLTSDYPFAPPYQQEQFVRQLARPSADGVGQVMQVTGVKGDMAYLAFGTWEVSWLRADAAGDQAGRTRAAAMMQNIAGWPILAQVNQAVAAHQLADAATRGDRAPLARDEQVNPLPAPSDGK